MSNHTKKRLEWRLRVMMAERGIKTIVDLQKRLKDAGVSISSVQLGRVADGMPTRLSSKLLAGLISVLRCGINDLIRVAPQELGD